MDLQTAIHSLSQDLKNEDWFFDISIVRNELVVYTHWMDTEVMKKVPSHIDKHRVLLHFASSKCLKDYKIPPEQLDAQGYSPEELSEIIPLYKSSNTKLTNDLDRLEKICGTHVLGDIFFEAHDGKNAVTNWSARYPEVRKEMDRLLEEYGFDVIYEEIEL